MELVCEVRKARVLERCVERAVRVMDRASRVGAREAEVSRAERENLIGDRSSPI